jgi:hypothetical protein
MNVIIERKCPQNVHPYSAHYVDSPFARRMAGLNTPTAQVQTAEQARLDIMALVNNRLHQTGKKLVVEKRVDFDSKRDVIMNGFLVRELIPQTNRRSKQGSTGPDLNSNATSSSIASCAVSGELPQVTPNARLTSTGKRKAGRYVAPFHELVQAAEKIKGTSNGKRVAKNLFLEDETTQVPLTKAPDGVEGTDASSANAQSSAENGEIGGEAIPESIEPNVHLTIARETERSTKVNTVELSLDGMEAGAEHSCYM